IVAGIPAYNEEKTIAKVILLAQKHVDKIIVCDDGSTDFTADIARKMGAEVIRHDRNLGYGAAIRGLFDKARTLKADIVLTLDADGQHNPGEIPKLLKPIQNNEADIVIGSRFLEMKNNEIPRYRRIGIKLLTRMSNGPLKDKISDAQSGFRAYNKKVIHALKLREKGMGVSAEILMKAGEQKFKVMEVPIGTSYKGMDTSTHNPLRHGLNVVAAILRLILYKRPLDFLGIPGTILFLAGTVMAIFFYYNYYLVWPPRFIPIVFFSSLALILAGTLAIFIAAMARARKPLLYLGVPGGVSFLVGFLFGAWMLQIYVTEHRIVTNIAVASIAFIFIGMFTVSTAINIIREQGQRKTKA
ncbi:glycosyltransferase, partial [Candidatus Bathyarchaeota archaeon]|nr:glycosyltransferase [Candidatus Bathyarchaeota archaeon]